MNIIMILAHVPRVGMVAGDGGVVSVASVMSVTAAS